MDRLHCLQFLIAASPEPGLIAGDIPCAASPHSIIQLIKIHTDDKRLVTSRHVSPPMSIVCVEVLSIAEVALDDMTMVNVVAA